MHILTLVRELGAEVRLSDTGRLLHRRAGPAAAAVIEQYKEQLLADLEAEKPGAFDMSALAADSDNDEQVVETVLPYIIDQMYCSAKRIWERLQMRDAKELIGLLLDWDNASSAGNGLAWLTPDRREQVRLTCEGLGCFPYHDRLLTGKELARAVREILGGSEQPAAEPEVDMGVFAS